MILRRQKSCCQNILVKFSVFLNVIYQTYLIYRILQEIKFQNQDVHKLIEERKLKTLIEELENDYINKDNDGSNFCSLLLNSGKWLNARAGKPDFSHRLKIKNSKLLQISQSHTGTFSLTDGNSNNENNCLEIYHYKISEIINSLDNLLIIGDSRARQYFRVIAGLFEQQKKLNEESDPIFDWRRNFKIIDNVIHEDLSYNSSEFHMDYLWLPSFQNNSISKISKIMKEKNYTNIFIVSPIIHPLMVELEDDAEWHFELFKGRIKKEVFPFFISKTASQSTKIIYQLVEPKGSQSTIKEARKFSFRNRIWKEHNLWIKEYYQNFTLNLNFNGPQRININNFQIMSNNIISNLEPRTNESYIYLSGDGTHILPRFIETDVKHSMAVNLNLMMNFYLNQKVLTRKNHENRIERVEKFGLSHKFACVS